jgi:hypothetical protein
MPEFDDVYLPRAIEQATATIDAIMSPSDQVDTDDYQKARDAAIGAISYQMACAAFYRDTAENQKNELTRLSTRGED